MVSHAQNNKGVKFCGVRALEHYSTLFDDSAHHICLRGTIRGL